MKDISLVISLHNGMQVGSTVWSYTINNTKPLSYLNVKYSSLTYVYFDITRCDKYGYSLGQTSILMGRVLHGLAHIKHGTGGIPWSLLSICLSAVVSLLRAPALSTARPSLSAAPSLTAASPGLTASPARWSSSRWPLTKASQVTKQAKAKPRLNQQAIGLSHQASIQGAGYRLLAYYYPIAIAYGLLLLALALSKALILSAKSGLSRLSYLLTKVDTIELAPYPPDPVAASPTLATVLLYSTATLLSVLSLLLSYRARCYRKLATARSEPRLEWSISHDTKSSCKCRMQDGQCLALNSQQLGSSSSVAKDGSIPTPGGRVVDGRVVAVGNAFLGVPRSACIVFCDVNDFILLLLRLYRNLAQKESFIKLISNLINNYITALAATLAALLAGWLNRPAELARMGAI